MRLFRALFLVLTVAGALALVPAGALAAPGEFKAGDTVEADYYGDGKWHKATVTEVLNDGYQYRVKGDFNDDGKPFETVYVMDPAAAERDAGAEERRALRDDIAVLDRLVVQLEARLPRLLPPDHAIERGGSRLLRTEELRAQRDALVRRLATVQDALERGSDTAGDDTPAPEAADARAPSPERDPLRVPRPGISPA